MAAPNPAQMLAKYESRPAVPIMAMLGSRETHGQDDRHRDTYDFSLSIHNVLN
jgi:hypothetical protein